MTIPAWIINNFTLIIAIWGAILSTIWTIWGVYNSLQDRAKVKVKTNFGFLTYRDGPVGEPQLLITAINKGKRPITLSSMGIRIGDTNLINMHTMGLPCKLEEGRSHCEWFKVADLKDKDCDFAWYKDETEKLYKSKSIRKKLHNYFNSAKIKGDLLVQKVSTEEQDEKHKN